MDYCNNIEPYESKIEELEQELADLKKLAGEFFKLRAFVKINDFQYGDYTPVWKLGTIETKLQQLAEESEMDAKSQTTNCFYCGGFHSTYDCPRLNEPLSFDRKKSPEQNSVHRIDCQTLGKPEIDCYGCKLAECHEVIRMLMSELRHNPRRDSEDNEQIDKIIKRAMQTLPEFKGAAVKEE